MKKVRHRVWILSINISTQPIHILQHILSFMQAEKRLFTTFLDITAPCDGIQSEKLLWAHLR